MDCIHPYIENCQPDKKCPDGYECCSENVPNGGKAKLGLCIRTNECDKTRGLPKKSCKDSTYGRDLSVKVESYRVYSREGYDDDDNDTCSEWANAFWVMVIVLCLVFFLIASWHFRTVKHK